MLNEDNGVAVNDAVAAYSSANTQHMTMITTNVSNSVMVVNDLTKQ